MNEQLLESSILQMCEHLRAIRKSGDWRSDTATFAEYAQDHWSLSKTRAKLMCDFATFASMVRSENLHMPRSPECVKPILELAQKYWLDVWRICLQYSDGRPINAKYCLATMDQFGFVARKRIPDKILKGRKVRRAAKTLAEIEDGEALVDEIGPSGLGHDWDMAVRVAIDADQAKRNKR